MNILKELWDAKVMFVYIGGCFLTVVALSAMARAVERAVERRRFRYLEQRSVDTMTGVEFERFLAGVFRRLGYGVTLTKVTGDFGADLLLTNPTSRERIALQAKRHKEPVGLDAVQEVHFARTFYGCQAAWVITTTVFTPAARKGARVAGVRLMDRAALEETLRRSRTKL